MKKSWYLLAPLVFLLVLTAACTTSGTGGAVSFAEAHDAFETTLATLSSDEDEVPVPPEGVFDLVYYESKVGDLAAYVSSDPADGALHPLVIWVVGGWGNGIDEFPWAYAEWDNDQTGAGFREAGLLMMYPSFRGANGNPGNYETLYGEVDDIVSAYDYAASLPYVDPDRIYLAGHSTGGTRVLLASEYTDKFRAVFSFGPVDEIQYHNTSQFTFDTSNQEEYRLRSPIYWLSDVTSPTFVIEGEGGNGARVKAMAEKSTNENLHFYVIDGADHFDPLAPVTRLLAQKILADTGESVTITLTDEEIQEAMAQEPVVSYPVMKPYSNETAGIQLQLPAIWQAKEDSNDYGIYLTFNSIYSDDNFWDMSDLFVDIYIMEEPLTLEEYMQIYSLNGIGYQSTTTEINGQTAFFIEGTDYDNGYVFYHQIVVFQPDNRLIELWFYTLDEYKAYALPLFQQILDSVTIS